MVSTRRIAYVAVVTLLAAVLALVACHAVPLTPHSDVVVNGTFVMWAGGCQNSACFPIVVTAKMLNPELVGWFTVYGQTGNAIQVAVMTDADFGSWWYWGEWPPARSGGYDSGPVTEGTDSFDVHLQYDSHIGYKNNNYYVVYGNSLLCCPESVTTEVYFNYDTQP
jgi:hypothetical protein